MMPSILGLTTTEGNTARKGTSPGKPAMQASHCRCRRRARPRRERERRSEASASSSSSFSSSSWPPAPAEAALGPSPLLRPSAASSSSPPPPFSCPQRHDGQGRRGRRRPQPRPPRRPAIAATEKEHPASAGKPHARTPAAAQAPQGHPAALHLLWCSSVPVGRCATQASRHPAQSGGRLTPELLQYSAVRNATTNGVAAPCGRRAQPLPTPLARSAAMAAIR